jgi:alkyl sulfatase BDS1-like metallo-beta-lactamase superfamily hydrolase
MNQVVFADPADREARMLAADALEQLGYQTEAGTWRNAYLYGAQELRNGMTKLPAINTLSTDALKALPLDMFFDFLGVRLNGPRADGKHMVINWNFTDTKQRYVLNLENAALTYTVDKQVQDADASVTLTRATLDSITLRQTTFPEALKAGTVQVAGDPSKLAELFGLLDNFEPMFEVVEPKPAR